MASAPPPSGTPGFRAQAGIALSSAQATLTDKEKREALAAEVSKHATELAALAKQNLADAEKRSQLLDWAKGFAAQAVTAAKDAEQRSALLEKVKATAATLQQVVQDPAKRQEVHDTLAATTYKLMVGDHAEHPAVESGEAPKA